MAPSFSGLKTRRDRRGASSLTAVPFQVRPLSNRLVPEVTGRRCNGGNRGRAYYPRGGEPGELEDRQDHLGARIGREPLEVGRDIERLLEQAVELLTVELHRAKLAQVVGHELRVEQAKAAVCEPGRQVHQGDLGGVALVGEHALAEEGAVERDPVEAADEARPVPYLHRVAMTQVEEVAVEVADALVDPGGAPSGPRGGAALDHAGNVGVDADIEVRRAQRAREPAGHVHLIEREDAAVLRLDPVERRVVSALGHGEDAAGVGLEQHLRRNLDDDVVARSHAICGPRNRVQSMRSRLGDHVPPHP